jgi:hypothetical protein
MHRGRSLSLVVFPALLLAPTAVRAQETGATKDAETAPATDTAAAETSDMPPPPPPASPPDLVRLKDGAMYRGTIGELVPEGQVTMVLVTGETRRFEMKDVAYAGPATDDPGSAPDRAPAKSVPREPETKRAERRPAGAPLVTVQGKPVDLRITADTPHLTLHVSSGMGRSHGTVVGVSAYPRNDWFVGNMSAVGQRFDRICTAPCEATLPAGTYTLAAAVPDEELVIVDDPVVLRESGLLRASYESNAGIRTTGWVVGGSSLVAGIALSLVGYYVRSTPDDCEGFCEEESNTAMMLTGIGIAFAGVIAGTIMVAIPDEVTLTFVPE